MMVTETAARPFTESLLQFLNALSRGTEGDTLEVHCRSEGGFGYQCLAPRISRNLWAYLPKFAVQVLEDGWSARIGAAVRGGHGAMFSSLAILFAAFPVEVQFGRETHWQHQADQAAGAAVRARLESFPLAPGFVIDGIEELVAVWPLVQPLHDIGRARRLQRRLAEVLGASSAPVALPIPAATMGGGHRIEYPADDPAAHLPFPGSLVRNVGTPPPVVTFAAVAPEHVYTLDQFTAALGREGTR